MPLPTGPANAASAAFRMIGDELDLQVYLNYLSDPDDSLRRFLRFGHPTSIWGRIVS